MLQRLSIAPAQVKVVNTSKNKGNPSNNNNIMNSMDILQWVVYFSIIKIVKHLNRIDCYSIF